jgi:urea transport system permease protein
MAEATCRFFARVFARAPEGALRPPGILVALVMAAWLWVQPASAQTLDAALPKLVLDDAESLKQGVIEIGNSSNPKALPILYALRDGKLKVDDAMATLFIDRDGGLVRAIDGKTGFSPRSLRTLVTSNAIRRALQSSIARLELTSMDVAVRRAAAVELSSRAIPEMAPLLRKAWMSEQDAETKTTLGIALAQVDLMSDSADARLSAVRLLDEASAVAFKPALERLVETDADGKPREPDARVRAAASSALASLWWVETRIRVAGDLMYGLSLGSVLLLAALGLAITFGLMGVINMAHGEMLMLGAYATYVVQLGFERYLPQAFNWYLVVALPMAFVVCAAMGVAIERGVLRFLYGRPLETLLATWGVSLGLIQTVRVLFGAQNVAVPAPAFLSGGVTVMEGVVLPYNRLAIVLFSGLVLCFVWLILTRTRLGLDVRAVTQNRGMASCMGISTARVDMWTFGIGSGVAGLGGVALSQIGNVGPELGQGYIVDSFMVVVLGGVGKLAGTVAGSFGLGIINKLLEPISGAVLGKIVVLGLIILFIQKRPQGIFALKGRAVEA